MANSDHDLKQVLQQLFESGVVSAEFDDLETTCSFPETEDFLLQFERDYRSYLGLALPAFRLDATLWSAKTFYRACQVYTHPETKLPADFAIHPVESEPVDPKVIYSVDVVFRFLPDLLRLFDQVSPESLAKQSLLELGHVWPLSSVGCPEVVDVDSQSVFEHPGLRTLYLDRIISYDDRPRMTDPLVKQLLSQYGFNHPTDVEQAT